MSFGKFSYYMLCSAFNIRSVIDQAATGQNPQLLLSMTLLKDIIVFLMHIFIGSLRNISLQSKTLSCFMKIMRYIDV